MSSGYHPSVWSAFQAIVARTGLFAVAVVFVTLVYWQLDPVGEGWWIVPALFLAGLWLVRVGLTGRADHRAIAQRLRGEPPREGQWYAVGGTAVALDERDASDILAYRLQIYDVVTHSGRSRSRHELRYDGFFLAPTGIDIGEAVVPLHGFPDLSHTPKREIPEDVIDRAKAAARRLPRILVPPLAKELAIAGPLTRLDVNNLYGTLEPGVVTRTDSWVLKKGEQVCVFGLWRNGTLRASYRRGGGLPVYQGTVEAVTKELEGESKGYLIAGAVVLALAAIVAIWSLL